METDDFKGFIKYLSSLWGALGSITVIFPLADVLFKVIPLPVDPYGKSTAPIAIPITSLVAFFMLFYTFAQRQNPRVLSARHSGACFMLGFVSLALFLLLAHFEYMLREHLFPFLDSTDDYILYLVGVVPFYALFFACVTRAFAILALMEFRHRQTRTKA